MKTNSQKIMITPVKSALLEGHRNKLNVLVRMQAPDLDPASVKPRQPYGIAFVIDRSGSMAGQPLAEAVRCVEFMVDKLKENDVAALVTFDSDIETDFPMAALGDKEAMKKALMAVYPGGSTNLFDGWRTGADEFGRTRAESVIKRVILLSDGCANQGLTLTGSICTQVENYTKQGITTSTYGLGRSFNEELMVEMARSGQGNHYYAETAEDLLESFNEEFDLMANLWTKQSTLQIKTEAGVNIRMMNQYRISTGQEKTWILPNIAYGSEAWAMLEVTVDREFKAGENVKLFSAVMSGEDIDGNKIEISAEILELPVVNEQIFSVIADHELVVRRLEEIQAANYLMLARNAALHGHWRVVDKLIQEAKSKFHASPWVQDVLKSMEQLASRRDLDFFSKEAMFSQARMSMRLSSKEELAGLVNESEKMSFLRRKAAQGKAQFFKDEDLK